MSGADRRSVMIGVGALAATLPTRLRARSGDSIVTTQKGRVRGLRENDLHVFRGIRYGQDTAGTRFRAPISPAPWTAIAEATNFAPSCPQQGKVGATSEDCLFLNIWTPQPDSRAKRPVVLYIHGGAYSNGSVVTSLNDGRHLAAGGDVVVVTVNHRLNALGYLYLARFDPRFTDSGNAGQLDLILALKWVRDNIAAFGGDPGRVMVFGQSGGGAKIATMTAMPAANGLFHRAITMSGQQVTASGPLNATSRARAYLGKLGVKEDNLAPLLALPTQALVDALDASDPILGGSVYFGPVLDMTWLTRHPFWPDASPQSRSIPMILGNVHDETRAFISPDSDTIRTLNWDNVAARIGPDLRIDILPEWVVAQYRKQFPTWSPTDVFYAATTAGRSWRGQVIEAEARAAAHAPTWVYQVDFSSRTDPRRGAFHTMDIPLMFGTLDAKESQTGVGADARAASQAMQARLLAFATTGDPNRAGLSAWPQYDLIDRATMIFDTGSKVENDPRSWQRTLFSRVPYIQPGS